MLILILISIDAKSTSHILELLGVFAAAGLRLMPSTKKIVSSIQSLRYALPSIKNIIDEFPRKETLNLKNIAKINIKDFKKKILVSNLSFKYRNQEEFLFKNLKLEIKKGKIIGVKGRTGSGKTTFLNLILGLVEPFSGTIIFDDHKFKDINLKSLHNLVGYVPQNIYLMDASIKDNISFFSNDISNTQIEESIDKANLRKFIISFPMV